MSILATLTIVAAMMQGIDSTGTAIARPIGEVHQDPTSGNYFQIFEFYGRPPHTWAHAKRMVRGYVYEGREGRLATVKELATHYFLILQFPEIRQKPSWIGLSVTCNEQADYTWIDGANLADQAFRAWSDGTPQKISRTCRSQEGSGKEYPIYYRPDEFGVRWDMAEPNTNLQYMVVEFAKEEPAEGADGAKKEEGAEKPGAQ